MSDDEYEIPLQDQRVFGAGIKRTKVHFVPSSTNLDTSSNLIQPTNPSRSIGDLYLSLVLPPSTSEPTKVEEREHKQENPSKETEQLCEVCSLPLGAEEDTAQLRPHAASLAHQVCLEHSHPPSHIDRRRKGLAYLSSYGWDPDARKGLGAQGQGIQFPIKAVPKDDKLGLGVILPSGEEARKLLERNRKAVKLDAKQTRKLELKQRQKGERLREMFYGNEDVDRYLGRSSGGDGLKR